MPPARLVRRDTPSVAGSISSWAAEPRRAAGGRPPPPPPRAAGPYVWGTTANATEVVPDKQGRIPIPQRLREIVGIGTAVMVVGVLDRIELWDPDRFQVTVEERTPELDRFVHQIFG
jgi:MraZ protein